MSAPLQALLSHNKLQSFSWNPGQETKVTCRKSAMSYKSKQLLDCLKNCSLKIKLFYQMKENQTINPKEVFTQCAFFSIPPYWKWLLSLLLFIICYVITLTSNITKARLELMSRTKKKKDAYDMLIQFNDWLWWMFLKQKKNSIWLINKRFLFYAKWTTHPL